MQTLYGEFHTWGCFAPESKPGPLVPVIFFVSYTVLTSFVILSLFVAVITMSMVRRMFARRPSVSAIGSIASSFSLSFSSLVVRLMR